MMDMSIPEDSRLGKGFPFLAPLSSDRFVTYDPNSEMHEHAFVQLLIQQAEAHGLDLDEKIAKTFTHNIGDQSAFDVTFIASGLGSHQDDFKGMMVTKDVTTVTGPATLFEDLIISPEARRGGSGKALFQHSMMVAWDRGKTGIVFELAQSNEKACRLFKSVDPAFTLSNLHKVWEIPEDKVAALTRNDSIPDIARLAIAYEEIGRASCRERV